MNRINLLNDNVSNKIAAGEVIERPYSVVKELIENSIDAKAKNIIIETEEGGSKKVKVIDDGIGIHPEDIKLAFCPHATSKINNIKDLFSIKTMGFRGEALASISSVSKVLLKSKTDDSYFGNEIYISGGNIEYIKECGCNTGTIIEVSDLFFNVPVRKKFLKSTQRETALISDIVMKLAIANPDIAFKLNNNGRKTITTYGNGDLLDTLKCVYDKNTYKNIIKFEKHIDIASVYGYIGNAEISRASRNNQSIFINNRYVKSGLIVAAVEKAFKSFLTVNKFPFFVLFLDIYPDLIDVNVHPTKSEVKFEDDREIFKLVFNAVHESLKNDLKDTFMKDFDPNTVDLSDKTINDKAMKNIQIPLDLKNNELIMEDAENIDNINKDFTINVIGQYHNTYILCEDEYNLYLIDQHAAHEKILFEKYRKEIKNESVSSQILINPVIFELSHEDFSIYVDNSDIFKNTGFDIEIFGNNTLSLKTVPIFLGEPNIKELFLDILDNLKNMGSGETIDVKYDAIAGLACKSAIKGNDILSKAEMITLVETLKNIEEPFTCPHGRPTIIKVPLNEIEKKFKRIQ